MENKGAVKGSGPKKTPKILDEQQAEHLFSQLDETGHENPSVAKEERKRRKATGVGLPIDPLSGKDPSGSNVEQVIKRTAIIFTSVVIAVILVAQIAYGTVRRINAGSLATSVSVESVAGALKGGVEWGDGFTQFPQLFSVQEANEATGRIEVTVIDTTSANEVESMAASYIQATAFATNALLNNDINTVVYRVQIHEGEEGRIQTAQFFGFLQPSGPVKNFMTFIFTKATSENGGFNIFCTITGLDEQTTQRLREKLGSSALFNLQSHPQKDETEAAEGTSESSYTS